MTSLSLDSNHSGAVPAMRPGRWPRPMDALRPTPIGGVPAARPTDVARLRSARREREEGRAPAELIAALGGDYQIVRPLARGGMARLFLARDVRLHRLVAVKALTGDDATSPAAREAFRREARMSGQLAHPNIVPLYAFGETTGTAWMVLPYVAGESLAERMQAAGRLPADETRRILCEVAEALAYAHRVGVVHRDLKPGNVLLERETGRVLLADFGVATRAWWDGEINAERRAAGTPAFMSPEQALGEPDLDARSDLYALGAVGYAMLTGRPPFGDGDYAAVLARHLYERLVPVRSLAPRTPRALADAIERCLTKEPAGRWRSAGELREALLAPRRAWWWLGR